MRTQKRRWAKTFPFSFPCSLFLALSFFGVFGCKTAARAPVVSVSTLAGGDDGFANGAGRVAQFRSPHGIAADAQGNLYVADTENHRIRKLTPTGEVSTLAGSDKSGFPGGDFADGKGKEAWFFMPTGITIDIAGNLYVADTGNSRIRKVTPEGVVSTFAGSVDGFMDGKGSAARFNRLLGLTMDKDGNLYVADGGNHRIRKVSPQGEVSTVAGSAEGFGKGAYVDGKGSEARFEHPYGIAIDAAGNLYVAEGRNHRIRKVSPEGDVSTFAIAGEVGEAREEEFTEEEVDIALLFIRPGGITLDTAGNLYVTDAQNHRIRKVSPQGEVSTFVGGSFGYADGIGSAAQFSKPSGITAGEAGNFYVTDNHRIRKLVVK